MADFTAVLLDSLPLGIIPEAQVFALVVPAAELTGVGVPVSSAATGTLEQTLENVRDLFTTEAGYIELSAGDAWFERVHSVPNELALGNIVSTVVREIEIYNAYRRTVRELQSATNNAGSGTSFVSLPTLPYDIQPQHSLIVEFRVSATGVPILEGTLEFELDTVTLTLPVTGTRVVLFPFLPESPLGEMLEFKTTILPGLNGAEQRVSVRKNPRQMLEMRFAFEDDALRRRLQSMLFGWQPGTFGVPVWFESRALAVAAGIGDTTVTVDTLYADFRVGSLAVLWQDESTYEALEISSFDSTSITFTSGLTKDFAAGTTLVMPLRMALMDASVGAERHPVNNETLSVMFRVLDNDSSLGSTAAFPTHDGKVLLNEVNALDGDTLPYGYEQQLQRFDNGAAALAQFSDLVAPRIITQKGFFCSSAQRLWQVRQLLHALRGPQVSFYLPTFYHDMVLADDVSSGSSVMDIEHISYTQYINGQAPNNRIMVELANGTIYYKKILSAEVISSTVERLTLSDTWAASFVVADVARVCYLQLARLSGDTVSLQHTNAGDTLIVVPVTGVQQ